MLDIAHNEAILFRILTAFFGEDRVVPQMSVLAVCGGEVPVLADSSLSAELERNCSKTLNQWARESKCLFTIVNHQNDPCLVIEFTADFSDIIDLRELERQRYLKPLLSAAGVPYIGMTAEEFSEIANPASKFDLFAFLKSRFEYS